MAKIGKRIENSYRAYLSYRDKYSASGIGLDRKLTLEEYEDAYKSWANYNAHNPQKTHIAREIAKDEQTFTRREAAAIRRRLKVVDLYEPTEDNEGIYQSVDKNAVKALLKKYKKSKDIYSLEFSADEAAQREKERRARLLERGKEPEYTIQQSARVILFNELRDAGLSYKEADEVLYG